MSNPIVEPDRAARLQRYVRRVNSARYLTAAADAGLVPTASRTWFDPSTGEEHTSIIPPRVARCRWACRGEVGVNHEVGAAHWSGVEHCASIWACPPCSAVVRHERAAEVQHASDLHGRTGGEVVMVTLTVRHRRDDSLARTLDGVMGGWGRLTKAAGWDHWRARWGVLGYVRAVEVTYGTNGWHPHIHALLFLDRRRSSADLDVMQGELHESRQGPWADAPEGSLRAERSRWGWAKHAQLAGARKPSVERGVTITRGGVKYVAKLQDLGESVRGIGYEMTRGDLKRGRAESLPVFALMDDPGPLWLEYFLGTMGRRCITWSQGLRELYPVPDKTDEEILAEAAAAPVQVVVPVGAYRRRLQDSASVSCRVLEAVESGDLRAAVLLSGGRLATDFDRDTWGMSRSEVGAFKLSTGRENPPIVRQAPSEGATALIRVNGLLRYVPTLDRAGGLPSLDFGTFAQEEQHGEHDQNG